MNLENFDRFEELKVQYASQGRLAWKLDIRDVEIEGEIVCQNRTWESSGKGYFYYIHFIYNKGISKPEAYQVVYGNSRPIRVQQTFAALEDAKDACLKHFKTGEWD